MNTLILRLVAVMMSITNSYLKFGQFARRFSTLALFIRNPFIFVIVSSSCNKLKRVSLQNDASVNVFID